MFATRELIILPEIRASLPITILILSLEGFLFFIKVPYAAANFTASMGVKFSEVWPPIVPLIPEIDLINVMQFFCV